MELYCEKYEHTACEWQAVRPLSEKDENIGKCIVLV